MRRRRDKRSKTYYMGMFVLFLLCAMYMILYPRFKAEEEAKGVTSASTESTSYEPAQNSAQLITGADNTKEQNAAQAAISAIEQKEQIMDKNAKKYSFRDQAKLSGHYEKHGIEMGFLSEDDYLAAANALINNPDALHKTEAEDGDDVYYLESTNEIAFVSGDGYIRTYFICKGKDYFDRQ